MATPDLSDSVRPPATPDGQVGWMVLDGSRWFEIWFLVAHLLTRSQMFAILPDSQILLAQI